MSENLPVLTEEKDLFIDNGGQQNFLIEGDNLASLQLLEKTHRGKIDLIYIDPPYNTGNKDFIYDDNFVDSKDTFRHSKWCSFMQKRLELARKLLSEKGVIFISIDDNEQAALKMLCDDVFGEGNWIETLMVEMSNTGGMKVGAAKKGKITKNGEFILIYSKTEHYTEIEKTPLYDFVPGFDTHFNLYRRKDGSICNLSDVLSCDVEIEREFNHFGIKKKNGTYSLKLFSKYFDASPVFQKFALDNCNEISRPRTEVPKIPDDLRLEKNKWIKYNSDKREESYFLSISENGDVFQLVPMAYNYRKTDDFISTFGRSVIRGDYWKGFWLDMGNISKEGYVDFENGKKPLRLISQLMKWSISTSPSSTILDFFAGSGTTGHAVLKLNAEDGGSRKFILCTNNENSICRDVTYERIKRVIQKENYAASLKYFRVEYIPITDRVYYDYADQLLEHTKELVELENAVNFTGNAQLAIILSEDELDSFCADKEKISRCKKIYLGHECATTAEQDELFVKQQISVIRIPNYYYKED